MESVFTRCGRADAAPGIVAGNAVRPSSPRRCYDRGPMRTQLGPIWRDLNASPPPPPKEETAPQAPRRRLLQAPPRPLIELAGAVVLLAVGLWAPLSRASQAVAGLAAVGFVWLGVLSWRRRRRTGVESVVPRVPAARAWLEAAATTLLMVAGIVASAAVVREPYETVGLGALALPLPALLLWACKRLAWATAQQLALQLFIWPLCREVLRSDGAGLVVAAGVFGLAHLPSPALTVATFVGAMVWIALFRRGGRLAPLIVAHALLWYVGHTVVPDRLSYTMLVGSRAAVELPRFRALASVENRAILRIVTTPEYFAAQGSSNRGLVTALYRDLLGRAPAEPEIQYWVSRMSWEPPTEVAKKFVEGEEMRNLRQRLGDTYRFPLHP
jgi:hypothetical protein